jgi:hypothetical protein
MKKHLIILFLFISAFSIAQDKDETSLVYDKKIAEVINLVEKEKEARNNDIETVNKSLVIQTEELKKSITSIQQQINNTDQSYLASMKRSRIGSIFLLIGLLVEVIGAILLASNTLVSRIEKIHSLDIDSGLVDMVIEDQVQKGVLIFLNGIGSLLIAFGFLLQFSGTILVIAQSGIELTIILSLGLLIPTLLFLFLVNRTPDQTIKEKISILFFNIKVLFLNKLFQFIHPRKTSYCDICGKIIKKKNGSVWYIKEDDTKGNNSLHKPGYVRFGHELCLLNDKLFTIELKTDSWMDQINTHKIYKLSCDEFVNHDYNKIKKWFKENKADWEIKKGLSYKCHYEAEYDRLFSRLK